jgi:hypothetical protein
MDPTLDATAVDTTHNTHGMMYYIRQLGVELSRFLDINGPIPVILFGLIVVSLGYILKTELLDRLQRKWRSANSVKRLALAIGDSGYDAVAIEAGRKLAVDRYRRMEAAMAQIGFRRPMSATPLTYGRLLGERLDACGLGGNDYDLEGVRDAVTTLCRDAAVACYAPSSEALELLDAERRERGDAAAALMDEAPRSEWSRELRKTRRRL